MGVNRHRVVAVVLNRRGTLGPAPGKRSRGELPLLALEHCSAEAAADTIAALDAAQWRSFNMVVADATGATFFLRGLGVDRPESMLLADGLHMITSSDPNDMTRERVARHLPRFRTAPPPDGLAEGIARLRRALRRGARVADPGNTLAVAQFELLAALAEHPGARPGQLARLLNMRPNTVTTIVNALSSRGMLDRVTAAGDRRAVELTVTEAGRQAVLAWQATNAAVLHLALSTLPARQRRALAAAVPALDALARAIDRLADHADHADHADAGDPASAQADPD